MMVGCKCCGFFTSLGDVGVPAVPLTEGVAILPRGKIMFGLGRVLPIMSYAMTWPGM